MGKHSQALQVTLKYFLQTYFISCREKCYQILKWDYQSLERWLSYSEDWPLLLRSLPGFQHPQDHLQMQLRDLMLFSGPNGHTHIHTVNPKVLKEKKRECLKLENTKMLQILIKERHGGILGMEGRRITVRLSLATHGIQDQLGLPSPVLCK